MNAGRCVDQGMSLINLTSEMFIVLLSGPEMNICLKVVKRIWILPDRGIKVFQRGHEVRIRKPGKIDGNLWFFGAEESGVYLLRGDHGTAMINGGMSYILPDVLAQMSEFGIVPGEITRLLILHSHFDHVGTVPYFKRNYPAIEVLASEAAVKTFEKPKAIEFINSYNQLSAGEMNESLKGFDLEWRADIEPSPVREGDIIDLGGVALTIYETPGHSNCSISAYEPVRASSSPLTQSAYPFRINFSLP